MAKGTRYTPEFKAIEQVAKDLGVAPETLRRWRNKTDATVAAETKQSLKIKPFTSFTAAFQKGWKNGPRSKPALWPMLSRS